LAGTGFNHLDGISYNKFLAKLATELGKPNGCKVISRQDIPEFLISLPVKYIWGVGEKTLKILDGMGIQTFGDLKQTPLKSLERCLGNQAHQFLQLAAGIDLRPVEAAREGKSLGREITFGEDLDDPEYLENVLLDFAGQLARRLRILNMQAQTVTLKIRYADFRTVTRRRTIPKPSDAETVFHHAARELLARLDLSGHKVRLIGLSLENCARLMTASRGYCLRRKRGRNPGT